MASEQNKNSILALVGASGVGKTTLMVELLKELPEMVFPIKVLTNRARRGPEDDMFCKFTTAEIIREMGRRSELIQYLEYAGNVYGCSREDVDWALSKGVGVQAYVESGIQDLYSAGYRVIPVKVVTDSKVYRDAKRFAADLERIKTHIDYQLILENSFVEGGLQKAVQQLRDLVLSL